MGGVDGEMKILIEVWVSAFASLAYCYFISFHIPKGKFRFLSLLPVFYFLTILPSKFTTVWFMTFKAFIFIWVANFKLLLFSFGKGPLSTNPSISLPLFIFIACSPFEIKPKPHSSPPYINLSRLSVKVLVYIFLRAVFEYKQYMHPQFMLAYFFCYTYLGWEFVFITIAALINIVLGVEFEQPFNEPYFSTSLQDFWGRRWNLAASNILRLTIYQPVMLTSMKVIGRKWAALLAVQSTFLVSGLLHEIIFYYMGRASPTWEVTMFFVLNGVLLVAEFVVKKVVKGRWSLHPLISWAFTMGTIFGTGFWLFAPQLLRCGADVRASRELIAFGEYLMELKTTIRTPFQPIG